MNNSSRRGFIVRNTALLAGLSLGVPIIGHFDDTDSLKSKSVRPGRPVHAFTKVLQFLNYHEVAEVLARHHFAGADLTVRKGGQVLPENVEKDLPLAVKALRNAGIDSYMITTEVIDANDKYTRPLLKTMANLGIRYYRTGYLDYDHSMSMTDNIERHIRTFEKLEQVNQEYDLHGGYQNHSGRGVGGPVWDLYPLLKDRDPHYLGVQYDIRHATVEGAVSWPLGLRMLAPWIKTIDIKDFIWKKNEMDDWRIQNVPLGEGMVNFDSFFNLYKMYGIEGPVSIHYEYDLGGAEHGRENPNMSLKEIEGWLKKDLTYLEEKLRQFDLKV